MQAMCLNKEIQMPEEAFKDQILGSFGPFRASSRFLMVSSSVATSGSLGGATSSGLWSESLSGALGTAFDPETACVRPALSSALLLTPLVCDASGSSLPVGR